MYGTTQTSYTHFIYTYAKSSQKEQCYAPRILSLVTYHTNVIISIGTIHTFTRNKIRHTRNNYRCPHENPHYTMETNFEARFSINV